MVVQLKHCDLHTIEKRQQQQQQQNLIKERKTLFYVQNIGRSQSDVHVEEFQKLISMVEVSKAVFTFTRLLVCVLCAWTSKSKYIHSCQDGWYLCWKLRRRGCFTYFVSFNSGAFAIIQMLFLVTVAQFCELWHRIAFLSWC